MIGHALHRQIFKYAPYKASSDKIEKSVKELMINGLLKSNVVSMENYNFPLPRLHGSTLEEHYNSLGYEFVYPYLQLAFKLAKAEVNFRPKKFNIQIGWTKYYSDGVMCSVPYPDCEAMIFDVETSVRTRGLPVMAIALSENHWYSWMSHHLFSDTSYELSPRTSREISLNDLIPFGPCDSKPRLIVGHNIAFDRSFIREEYLPTPNFLNFIDTMSIHTMMRGYSHGQRTILTKQATLLRKSAKSDNSPTDDAVKRYSWKEQGCFGSLKALAEYYLNVKLNKSPVDLFIEARLPRIFKRSQHLFNYCANDVEITLKVFKKIWPSYHSTAPHPITLAGMLMMAKCYIPITNRWKSYITRSDKTYRNYYVEMNRILTKIIYKHLHEGLENSSYRDDPWLKNFDWRVACHLDDDNLEKHIKIPASRKAYHMKNKKLGQDILREALQVKDPEILYDLTEYMKWFPDLPKSHKFFAKNSKVLKGYPVWFEKLLKNPRFKKRVGPRPSPLAHGTRMIPLLLKLSWNGFPLQYSNIHQWGFIVPKDLVIDGIVDIYGNVLNGKQSSLQFRVIKDKFDHNPIENKVIMEKGIWNDDSIIDDLVNQDFMHERLFGIFSSSEYIEEDVKVEKKPQYNVKYRREIVVYENVCHNNYFVPIPHPDGKDKLCGYPLGNEYTKHINSGTIVPMTGKDGLRFIHLYQSMSFWKNNRDRVAKQTTVYFKKEEMPKEYRKELSLIGAIIPRIIPAGTVTRRAIERTWLTAINPQVDLIGSEFKSAVMAPEDFCFVGADVDSEEMWIASLIADAATVGTYGGTPFSYMSIQGSKSHKTDIEFAKSMIKQYQPELTENEATIKAVFLYNFTKGLKCVELTSKGEELVLELKLDPKTIISSNDFQKMMGKAKISPSDQIEYGRLFWKGGTESEIFNILDLFTKCNIAATPILNVALPRPLLPSYVRDEFTTSRMNWVVQSSAVDFLHMFLVTCFWLFSLLKIPARLALCIHDEIRFMVPIDKRYEAAFALHIANLYTRCAFSQKLGIYDLPQSCAFFSGVDIDKVLRKDPTIKCQTPSNPEEVTMQIGDFKCNKYSYNLLGEILNFADTLEKVDFDIFTDKKIREIKEYFKVVFKNSSNIFL
ncbi:hypothetical protein MXB_5258 [Myxobolus squamalis]|nr:hypothetical protein MXB_5258 [Myxobolus squamalis]